MLRPQHPNRLHQNRKWHVSGLPAVENRLDDGRRKERQPQNPTDVRRIDLLRLSNLVDGPVNPGLQQLAPPKPARDGLDHGVVDPRSGGNPARYPVWSDDLLAAAALAYGEGYLDGDRLGRLHQAARRWGAVIPARS